MKLPTKPRSAAWDQDTIAALRQYANSDDFESLLVASQDLEKDVVPDVTRICGNAIFAWDEWTTREFLVELAQAGLKIVKE